MVKLIKIRDERVAEETQRKLKEAEVELEAALNKYEAATGDSAGTVRSPCVKIIANSPRDRRFDHNLRIKEKFRWLTLDIFGTLPPGPWALKHKGAKP